MRPRYYSRHRRQFIVRPVRRNRRWPPVVRSASPGPWPPTPHSAMAGRAAAPRPRSPARPDPPGRIPDSSAADTAGAPPARAAGAESLRHGGLQPCGWTRGRQRAKPGWLAAVRRLSSQRAPRLSLRRPRLERARLPPSRRAALPEAQQELRPPRRVGAGAGAAERAAPAAVGSPAVVARGASRAPSPSDHNGDRSTCGSRRPVPPETGPYNTDTPVQHCALPPAHASFKNNLLPPRACHES